jgi:hypothetical protein
VKFYAPWWCFETALVNVVCPISNILAGVDIARQWKQIGKILVVSMLVRRRL